ncbi:unnamed protein product [Dracunculus medinensis]|uniref:Uncharacterized protein n=1 Tax=Dracunculus medinensis TaxID=318479 RepID=A0A0N4U183_DRAME|nr:unnamed protein product [Dracunculus medinensis]
MNSESQNNAITVDEVLAKIRRTLCKNLNNSDTLALPSSSMVKVKLKSDKQISSCKFLLNENDGIKRAFDEAEINVIKNLLAAIPSGSEIIGNAVFEEIEDMTSTINDSAKPYSGHSPEGAINSLSESFANEHDFSTEFSITTENIPCLNIFGLENAIQKNIRFLKKSNETLAYSVSTMNSRQLSRSDMKFFKICHLLARVEWFELRNDLAEATVRKIEAILEESNSAYKEKRAKLKIMEDYNRKRRNELLRIDRIELLRKIDNIPFENLERELAIFREKIAEAEAETLNLTLKIRTRQTKMAVAKAEKYRKIVELLEKETMEKKQWKIVFYQSYEQQKRVIENKYKAS